MFCLPNQCARRTFGCKLFSTLIGKVLRLGRCTASHMACRHGAQARGCQEQISLCAAIRNAQRLRRTSGLRCGSEGVALGTTGSCELNGNAPYVAKSAKEDAACYDTATRATRNGTSPTLSPAHPTCTHSGTRPTTQRNYEPYSLQSPT